MTGEAPAPDDAAASARSVRALERAFGRQVEPLRPALYAFCRSLARCAWDAEDLVQESILRAFARSGEVAGGIRDLRAYLFRTATHLWIDEQRRHAPSLVAPEDLPERAEPDVPTRPELREALAELARRLPPRERVALLLRDVFAFPAADVARFLRTTEGAVKAALHRARERVRRGTAEREAPSRAGLDVPPGLADAFAAAFTAKDVPRLLALMQAGGATELVGVARDVPESLERGTFVHTVGEEGLLRGERREYLGERIVLLWYAVEEDGRRLEVVRDLLRLDAADDRCARLRYYYFCPEVLVEVARDLGVPVRTNGYRP